MEKTFTKAEIRYVYDILAVYVESDMLSEKHIKRNLKLKEKVLDKL